MATTLTAMVWRSRQQGEFSRYEVPRQASQTVLDVVTFIQRRLEPSLAYRYACRVGMCGSCAMTVNGIARWTCRTLVSKVAGEGGKLEIAPLSNLPVIKDLVTDMSEFFDKWARAKGRLEGARSRREDPARIEPATPERAAADAGELDTHLDGMGVADDDRAFNPSWHDWLNLRSLIAVSKVIATSALAREDSCGAHFREDFPRGGDRSDSSYVVVTDSGAGLSLAREPVRFSRVAPGATILEPQPAVQPA